jgi:hypothetical protein
VLLLALGFILPIINILGFWLFRRPPLSAVSDVSIEVLRIFRLSSEPKGKLAETMEDFDQEIDNQLHRTPLFPGWRVTVGLKPSSVQMAGYKCYLQTDRIPLP